MRNAFCEAAAINRTSTVVLGGAKARLLQENLKADILLILSERGCMGKGGGRGEVQIKSVRTYKVQYRVTIAHLLQIYLRLLYTHFGVKHSAVQTNEGNTLM